MHGAPSTHSDTSPLYLRGGVVASQKMFNIRPKFRSILSMIRIKINEIFNQKWQTVSLHKNKLCREILQRWNVVMSFPPGNGEVCDGVARNISSEFLFNLDKVAKLGHKLWIFTRGWTGISDVFSALPGSKAHGASGLRTVINNAIKTRTVKNGTERKKRPGKVGYFQGVTLLTYLLALRLFGSRCHCCRREWDPLSRLKLT